MQLKEYLDKYGISIAVFSRQCGCSTATIHNIIKHGSQPGVKLAHTIEKISEGCVTMQDLAEPFTSEYFKKKKSKEVEKK